MIARRAALGVGSVVLGALLAELVMRAIAAPVMSPAELRAASLVHVPSAHARSELQPVARVVQPRPGVTWRLNDEGLRGAPLGRQKPENTARLLVLGGSAAFDLHASDPDDWPHRVGRLLAERLRAPRAKADDRTGLPQAIEVLNAAIPGHSTADSAGRLRAYGQRWQPDVVLLYHGWNELKDLAAPVTPDHALSPNPLLQPQPALVEALTSRSQLAARLWHASQQRAHDLQDRGLEGRKRQPLRAKVDAHAGLARYEAALHRFVDACARTGATPVLILQARLLVAESPAAQLQRVDLGAVGLARDEALRLWGAVDAVQREVAQQRGAVLIDAARALSGKPGFFQDHVHLTPAGSAALAEALAQPLSEALARRLSEAASASPGRPQKPAKSP